MSEVLHQKRVAFLATDGVEQAELQGPLEAIGDAGAETCLISLKAGEIQAVNHLEQGDSFEVDAVLGEVNPEEFDALVIPGGLANPDTLRSTPAVVEFVRRFGETGRVIGAICHAPWVLIEAGLATGRTLTSWPAIQSDIRNAGGNWIDREVVVDESLITSRKPDDVPAFSQAIIDAVARQQPVTAANR